MLLEFRSNKTLKYIDSLPTHSLSLPLFFMCQRWLCRQNTKKGCEGLVNKYSILQVRLKDDSSFGWRNFGLLYELKIYLPSWLLISNLESAWNNWLGFSFFQEASFLGKKELIFIFSCHIVSAASFLFELYWHIEIRVILPKNVSK